MLFVLPGHEELTFCLQVMNTLVLDVQSVVLLAVASNDPVGSY